MAVIESVHAPTYDVQSHYSSPDIAGIKALGKLSVSSEFINAWEKCANDLVNWTQTYMVM